ncbi:Ionotropic receptor 125, partial [Hyalella azteca]
SAQVEDRIYLSYGITDKFTSAEGDTCLYVAREGAFLGLLAWPLTLDAPYKPRMDLIINRAAGLYHKWHGDVVHVTMLKKLRVKDKPKDFISTEHPTPSILTQSILRASLALLGCGYLWASLTFSLEFAIGKFSL